MKKNNQSSDSIKNQKQKLQNLKHFNETLNCNKLLKTTKIPVNKK